MRQRGFGGGSGGGGGGVTSATGTAHQIIVSAASGAVTFSTPQNIDTNSDVTFNTVTATATGSFVGGTGSSATGQLKLKNATNNNVLTLQPGVTASNLTLNLPTADGTNGQVLTTNGSGSLGFTTGGGTPGGASTNVQVNNGSGGFTGDASFTYSTTTHNVTVLGSIIVSNAVPLLDANSKNLLGATAVGNAVNYLTLSNASTTTNPSLTATGTDGNIGINITPKGSGNVELPNAIKLRWGANGYIDDNGGFANQLQLNASNGITLTSISGVNVTSGPLAIKTAGKTVSVKTGANCCLGTGTLSSGSATISTTAVTASSFIFLTDTSSGIVNVGALTVSAINAGTNFIVKSTNVSDAGTFNWLIIEPS